MSKKIFFIILLLSGIFECCNIAYGANLQEIDVSVDRASVLDALIDNLNLYTTPIYSNTFSTFENKWNSSSSVVCMFYLNSVNNRNYCRLVAGTSNEPLQPTTGNINMTYYSSVADLAQGTSTTKYIQSGNGAFSCSIGSGASNIYFLYLDNNGTWWEYSEIGFSVADLKPPFNFEANFDIKNNSVNVLKRSYSVNDWQLGTVTDLGDYDYYLFDLHAANEELDTIIQSKYDHSLNRVAGRYLTLATNGALYITSRQVLYDLTYRLTIQLFKDGSLVNQSFYLYKFLPLNSVLQNTSGDEGIIVSVGSGDYNIQDSTNATIEDLNDTSSVESVKQKLLESGELLSQLDYKEYPNHSYEILFALTSNIVDTLYASGDVYIDIQFDHNNYFKRIYASDFTIPYNNLTSWIILAVNFGFVYLLYKQGAELIHTIQEGDLYVLELEDANEYFYM